MKRIRLIILSLAALLATACSAPKIAYLEDINSGQTVQIANVKNIRILPDDKISILVNSRDPLLSNLFNLPYVTRQLGAIDNRSSYSQGLSGNTVDTEGNIDFPVLGKVHVAGLTRSEIAAKIKGELEGQNLVKDPVVTVEFLNLTVSVLGEVQRPGRFSIDKDRVTILDAISMAGDLTIQGKRENVLVQRDTDGKTTLYRVDLTKGSELYASPVFYLQQNDVVYVEPNAMKARQATVNGNNVRSTAFWFSLVSVLTSIATTVTVIVTK